MTAARRPVGPAGARLPLFLFLGQSYFGLNSGNGRVLGGEEAPGALMLDGAHGLYGAGHLPMSAPYTGLAPAADLREDVQSPVTAFLYRYARRAPEQGLPPECIGHSESRSNGSVEHLLPAEHPHHRDSSVFRNVMIAVSAYATLAQRRGARPEVPAVLFCQGTGDRTLPKEEYLTRLRALFDALSVEISGITGQADGPRFLIVQPPAKPAGGRWPCLQAHVEICAEREDCHMAVSGWAVPQHDRTHFSGEGAVMVGEACAEVHLGLERGEDLRAPVIRRARRSGRVIRVEASHDLVADPGPDTPRHRLAGAPIRNHGLQLDRGEIASCRVEGRRIEIEIAPGAEEPGELYFACTSRGDLGLKGMRSKANQSVNRGNLRADRSIESLFLDAPLHRWLASGAVAIERA